MKKCDGEQPISEGINWGNRQNAKNVWRDIIRRKENELLAIQIIDKCIPWEELSKEDEEKLWGYFIKQDN
jgi:hypothetical protein